MKLTTLIIALLLIIGCSSVSEPIISNEDLMTSHITCKYHQFTTSKINTTYDTIDCVISEKSGFITKDVCWYLSLTCDDSRTKSLHSCGQAKAGMNTYYTIFVSDFNFGSCNKFTNFQLYGYNG